MRRRLAASAVLVLLASGARAVELPSFLQAGDAFCTNEADFNDYAAHGRIRPGSAIETCVKIERPTRVAILSGQGGMKTMVRVMNGSLAYNVGWTNGKLPVS